MMAGAGLDAMIVYNIDAKIKASLGKVAYWVGGFSQFGRALPEFQVRSNGHNVRCSFALASRVKNYGGDLSIARNASLFSDQFEVVLFQGGHSWPYMKYLLGVVTNRLTNMRGVEILQTQSLEMECASDPGIYVQVDGEFAGRLPVRLSIVPNALTLLIPDEFDEISDMDNLTHTLTGVMLSRAGLDRLTPRAGLVAAIAANIPDIDAVTIAAGTETYFRYHRGFTHSLLCAPFIAVLPVLAVAAIFRTRLPWVRAWLLSFLAVLSHLLLDFTNPYGIRLFLPFSDAWPGLDSTHVIDIWIWAILLAGVCWPMLSSLVSSEIGAMRSKGRGMAVTALVLLAFYDTGRYFLHERAMATLAVKGLRRRRAASSGRFPREFHSAPMDRLGSSGTLLDCREC